VQTISKSFASIVYISFVVGCVQLNVTQLPEPERFEDEIRRFEQQDRVNPPPQGAIVLTGSSSIARWNSQAEEALAPLSVIPRGFGGSVMNDVLHYLDRVALIYKPRAILIYEGDNDTGRDAIPEQMILDQLRQIIARIHAELPDTRIYLLAVKPSILRRNFWSVAQGVSVKYEEIAADDPLV